MFVLCHVDYYKNNFCLVHILIFMYPSQSNFSRRVQESFLSVLVNIFGEQVLKEQKRRERVEQMRRRWTDDVVEDNRVNSQTRDWNKERNPIKRQSKLKERGHWGRRGYVVLLMGIQMRQGQSNVTDSSHKGMCKYKHGNCPIFLYVADSLLTNYIYIVEYIYIYVF